MRVEVAGDRRHAHEHLCVRSSLLRGLATDLQGSPHAPHAADVRVERNLRDHGPRRDVRRAGERGDGVYARGRARHRGRRVCHHQRHRWLPRHRAHAEDVQVQALSRHAPATPGAKLIVAYAIAATLAVVLAFVGPRDDAGIHVALGGASFPYAFVLFGLVLLGVAFFHHHTLAVALAGVVGITAYTAFLCPGFEWSKDQAHAGLLGHALHEGEHTLLNLGGLLQ